ncbi:GIY-YIG nuclease family protein [Salinivibrio sp. KP-1]|uniref:GIY-YIG nuclease family protein n=1 Tax=Salinivibrio sp. KP-1 TaxID=1406902 RepID=UPI0006144A92|nr:GIY-YIG nuclease family protein [Salinivibrio sp. KP-1]KKA44359.1 hypothetical protein WN56_11730 [Salinivibrio sp. KP-1]
MSSERLTLDELLQDLPEGLFEEENIQKSPRSKRASGNEFFDRINEFVDTHGREPEPSAAPGTEERILGLNLKGVRRDPDLVSQLHDADRHNLLPVDETGNTKPDNNTSHRPDVLESSLSIGAELKCEIDGIDDKGGQIDEFSSLDEVLADDDLLGFLNMPSEADDVFEMKHIGGYQQSRKNPDEIADRELCHDFDFFAPLFHRMRGRIAEGIASIEPFQQRGQIEVGDYFFLRGQMCLVDSITAEEERESGPTAYRVRVIFDNGTEMTPYKHSLGRALTGYKSRGYEPGQRIVDPDIVADRFNGLTHRDQSQGIIYVLRSKRTDKLIREQRDLYKVGLTARSLEDRLQGAEGQKTYLEGPVEVVAEWEIYGANLQRVERLLHAFLAPRRSDFTLVDVNGRTYHPREWFNVPFLTIKRVAEAIINDTLMNYRLNPMNGELVAKGMSQSVDDGEI